MGIICDTPQNAYALVERMRLLCNLRPLLRNKKQVASDFFFISGGAYEIQTHDLYYAIVAL